ncbi:DUF7093 family protein [Haladaptatus sp. NG-WS-4]
MGLRCSLLGHDYGESEIEREREEQGNEVVVTVREFKECARCGDQSVVSENKEVTAIEEPEPTPEPIESQEPEPEPVESEYPEPATEPIESPESEAAGFNDDGFEPPESAEEDDGIILEDDNDEEEEDVGERGHGEWPDPEDTNVDDTDTSQSEWPETGLGDEGFDTQPGDSGRADVEFGGSLTPESAPEVDDDTEYVEAEPREDTGFVRTTRPEPQTDTGFTRAREAPSPDQATESNPNAELVCPECGNVDTAAGSSLRTGDICPECRRGYLSEQE